MYIPWWLVLAIVLFGEFCFLWWVGLDPILSAGIALSGVLIAWVGGRCEMNAHRRQTGCEKQKPDPYDYLD